MFTDSPFQLVQAESHHRGHAIVEQVFADLLDGALAHLPGKFNANAAWLQLAATAHALTRALGARLPRHVLARAATIRTSASVKSRAWCTTLLVGVPRSPPGRRDGRSYAEDADSKDTHDASAAQSEPLNFCPPASGIGRLNARPNRGRQMVREGTVGP